MASKDRTFAFEFFKLDDVTFLMETVEMSEWSRYSAGGDNTWGIPGVYGTWNRMGSRLARLEINLYFTDIQLILEL